MIEKKLQKISGRALGLRVQSYTSGPVEEAGLSTRIPLDYTLDISIKWKQTSSQSEAQVQINSLLE